MSRVPSASRKLNINLGTRAVIILYFQTLKSKTILHTYDYEYLFCLLYFVLVMPYL